ncbi:MAG: diguanylate cyclase domain-containing protein [Candidatus Xenobia bacterium]
MMDGRHRTRAFLLIGMALVLLCPLPLPARQGNRAKAVQEYQWAAQEHDITQQLLHLHRAIDADPRFAPAWFQQGKLTAEHGGDLDKAIKDLQMADKLWAPDADGRPPITELLAEYMVKAKRYKDAEPLLEKLAKDNPNDPRPEEQLGQILLDQNQPLKARPHLQKAIQINKNDLIAHLRLADADHMMSDDDAALAEYDAVLDKAPQGGDLYTQAETTKDQIQHDRSMKRLVRGAAVFGVALLVILLGMSALRKRGGGSSNRAPALPPPGEVDLRTRKGVLENALYQLARLSTLSEAIGYIINMEKDTIWPEAELNMSSAELTRIPLDAEKFPAWLERIGNEPFKFAQEKREGTFVQGFGDLKDQMESRNMRLGVPLVHNKQFYGLIFLGMGQNDPRDQLVVKKIIDKNMKELRRIAAEAAGSLAGLMETEQSYMDLVTKLSSPRYVDEHLLDYASRAQMENSFCIGVMFEYDTYQQIHETYGEGQSVTLLKLLAGEVRRVFNEDQDLIARLEGGRFFALVVNPDEAYAVNVATRLREQIKAMKISRTLPAPSATIGIAVLPTHANSGQELMNKANDALNLAIGAGRGSIHIMPLRCGASLDGPAPAPPPPAPGRATPAPAGPVVPAAANEPPQRPFGFQARPPANAVPGPSAPSLAAAAAKPEPEGPAAIPQPFVPSRNPVPPVPGSGFIPGRPTAPSPAGPGTPNPFIPGRPAAPPAAGGAGPSTPSPFIPGRPSAAPGPAQFVPGRPAAAPGPSPFSPGRPAAPAPAPPAADAAPPASATPPAFIPSRLMPPSGPAPAPGAPPPYMPKRTTQGRGGLVDPNAAAPENGGAPEAAPPAVGTPAPAAPRPAAPGFPGRPATGGSLSRTGNALGRSAGSTTSRTGRTTGRSAASKGPGAPSAPAAPATDGPVPAPPPFVASKPMPTPPPPPAPAPVAPAAPRPIMPPTSAGSTPPTPPPFIPSRPMGAPGGPMPRPMMPAPRVAAPPAAPRPAGAPPNGAIGRPQLEQLISQRVASGQGCAVIYVTIDNFEALEAVGPGPTEQVVSTLSSMMRDLMKSESATPSDACAPWGRNAWVILKGQASESQGVNFAELVRLSAGHLNFPDVNNLTLSLGVATYPQQADSPQSLVERAREASVAAHSEGGNATRLFGS